MTKKEAASPPLSFPVSAGRGYGAAPPASRALRVAMRRAYGPPLTPEPLRPLTAQRHGQEQSPCPPKRPALTTRSHQTRSLRFQGIATLGRWVNGDRRARQGGDGRLDENEREELKRLRAENAELAMERDVLKRSVALWVKEAMRR